jgi:cytochrome c5
MRAIKLAILLAIVVAVTGCGDSVYDESTRTVESLYWQSCASCHNSGRAGAPVAFDETTWQDRLDNKSLWLSRVKEGYRGMPARGMCSDCTDDELIALINYISSPANLTSTSLK